MKIIKATSEHLSGIVEINKIINYGNPEDFMIKSLNEETVFVAVDNSEVIGYLLYQLIWGNAPFISLIKILPDFQKKGIGTELLQICEDELRGGGFDYYYSSTGDYNKGAQNFHEKLGFSGVGELKMNFGNEMFYKKSL